MALDVNSEPSLMIPYRQLFNLHETCLCTLHPASPSALRGETRKFAAY